MELILESGINHIDTAASYGMSEERIGPWTAKYRDRFFLASKTEERGYAGARDSIHRSLERLHTDHLDSLQLHAVIEDSRVGTGPRAGRSAGSRGRSPLSRAW